MSSTPSSRKLTSVSSCKIEVIAVRIAGIASRVSDACDSPHGGKHTARKDNMQPTDRSKETTPRDGEDLHAVSSECTRF